MIKDGFLSFSNLASGDSPTAIGDTPSANVVDQGSAFGQTPFGNAYVAPFLVSRVSTAFASAGAATMAVALQDSADNVTFADVAVSPTFAVAALTKGARMAYFRLPQAGLRRYLRVVYRIGAFVMTAGVADSFITLDVDTVDLNVRKDADFFTAPTPALNEAANQGVLDQ